MCGFRNVNNVRNIKLDMKPLNKKLARQIIVVLRVLSTIHDT
jgi:hypothetical protein